jgi:hypothetical protein
MTGQQVDSLLFSENIGFSYNQIFDTPPGIGNIVGQPSGTVRNIPGGFKDGYIQIGLAAFGPAGSTHPSCIATDDDKLHGSLLSLLAVPQLSGVYVRMEYALSRNFHEIFGIGKRVDNKPVLLYFQSINMTIE